jgi:hypothetical protein
MLGEFGFAALVKPNLEEFTKIGFTVPKRISELFFPSPKWQRLNDAAT